MITRLISGFIARLMLCVLQGIFITVNFTDYHTGFVHAAELSCGGNPVHLDGQPYAFIQAAYNDITPGGTGTISTQAVEFRESLILDRDVTVTLTGGYDCDFNNPPTLFSTIHSMTIRSGTVIGYNIILKDVVYPSTLPDTGQETSLTTTFGEDHDYTINPPSYTLNVDGTTTDDITGLMWQSSDDANLYNWYEASGTPDDMYNPGGVVDVCGELSLAGYNDWRLPNENELHGIVDYDRNAPSIDLDYFPDTASHGYWASTTHAYYDDEAWLVDFDFPIITPYEPVRYNSKDMLYRVRCVRGERISQFLSDNGDGTVTDMATGLIWQQGDDSTVRTWQGALTYCEDLELPTGQSDWRLPNIKELRAIVANTTHSPALDLAYFPNANFGNYWSSTHGWAYSHHIGEYVPSGTLFVSFTLVADSHDDGYINKTPTSNDTFTRCVRGGL